VKSWTKRSWIKRRKGREKERRKGGNYRKTLISLVKKGK